MTEYTAFNYDIGYGGDTTKPGGGLPGTTRKIPGGRDVEFKGKKGSPSGGSSAQPSSMPIGEHMGLVDKGEKMNTDIGKKFLNVKMPVMKGPTVTKKNGQTVTLDVEVGKIKTHKI